MDTIYMTSENCKTSEPPHVLILKLTDKLDLTRGEKSIALSNLSIYYTWKKHKKAHTITINLKYQLQHRMMHLNYQTDHILNEIFKITLNIF